MSDTEIRSAPTPFMPPGPDRMPGASNGRDGPTDLSVREITHGIAARRWLLLGVAVATFQESFGNCRREQGSIGPRSLLDGEASGGQLVHDFGACVAVAGVDQAVVLAAQPIMRGDA